MRGRVKGVLFFMEVQKKLRYRIEITLAFILWEIMQINRLSFYMKEALKEAHSAFLRNEIPVGAVLVDPQTEEIIARASNEMNQSQDPTRHAEMIVIQKGLSKIGTERFWDKVDLYVTLEPCPMCAQALSFMRLRRLYYGAYDPKSGGVEHGPRIFETTSCHHQPEVYGGIEETGCQHLLKSFFKNLRVNEVLS